VNCGGETIFCDTHKVFESLSEQERNFLAGYSLTYKTEKLSHYGGEISVPVVQDNVDTQEKILRFAEPVPATLLNPVEVSVDGLDEAESVKLIDGLVKHCYRKENCYIHVWEKNDLLLADNHTLLHARRAFKKFSPRHLRRIQIL
jgi:alpha-ketoglutarate-dependent taurine dioxygenase